MTHISKPSFSEGLTNDLTPLGIYPISTWYTWLAAIAKAATASWNIPTSNTANRGGNDTWSQYTKAAGKSFF